MPTIFARLLLASSFVIATTAAHAMSFADLSNQDASTGLKAALDKGSSAAVSKLGVDGGFLNNDKVKIQLPSILEKARPILQMTGKGQQLDELVVSMNRAAESAVPMAKPLLVNAVKSMSLTDAKNILTGGETSVTDFFREKTSTSLSEKFLPMVKGVTDKAGLSAKYNAVMGQAQKFGAVAKQEATVEGYVTQKAMDALFLMIAEEEKAIRQDPLGAGSKAISKVFSLLK
ncbi:DUF4197 domain-containing protein [Undibacterium sp. Ji42W]|uniref:DUF4197 domain-containing protein n=1 Tax=Undibacterium sp. Ji42W TaxID=3413039 RepID=UPI003BF2C807